MLTGLLQRYFIDNRHCVKIAFIPSENLAEKASQEERKQLDAL